MKKYLLIVSILIFSISVIAQSEKQSLKEAYGVIKNFAPDVDVKLQLDDNDNAKYFEREVKDGTLYIKGSSGVALCRGFYNFIKENNYGQRTWSGARVDIPDRLEDSEPYRVVSPFDNHFYLNVVTYGYTTPYWNWDRWSEEIDYMALHGIDMPLALVANEAITQRVFEKLGLTKEQIADYFTAPAHFPWMRMGNMSRLDSPLPQQWHKEQIALQHKILKKMRALGMKPICPAFAGFVPEELKELYPDIEIVKTSWAGAFENWMISPKSELFAEIGTMFIEEWEREFGENRYYLADSFNEMEIPFPPIGTSERYELLTEYGENLYRSIEAANADAVWVMQGWMFGYQREIWEPASLAALCKNVPDDKMLLLDEAVDYNKHFWYNGYNWDYHKGFYNKPWIYGTIPSMGGKSGWTGVLEFYANGHLEALNSENRGRLVGYGTAPEGVENNEVIYELIWDAGWSNKVIDIKDWLHNYTIQRYGGCLPNIDKSWDYLLNSVYGTFTDHPRYNWQSYPGSVSRGTINTSSYYFKGIESFMEQPLDGGDTYIADVVEMAAGYLGGKAEIVLMQIENDILLGNREGAKVLSNKFFELLLAADRLLESHPNHRFDKWLNYARSYGDSDELKGYYEQNARRLITIWGPPINDYSARIWSGLIRDYYVPRYRAYFKSKIDGDDSDFNLLTQWESNFVTECRGVSVVEPYENPIEAAFNLISDNSYITLEGESKTIASWSDGNSLQTIEAAPSFMDINSCSSFKFSTESEGCGFEIVSISILLDDSRVDVEVDSSEEPLIVTKGSYKCIDYILPVGVKGNNICKVVIGINGSASGRVEIVKGRSKN